MNVIDLAQLLSGALDGKFNITNQPAVIKVVTCLETFNITHESYREVQSTRIIKDLQALRQNKANDQVLAKRIKNILRKWKERLAATTVPIILASQPGSPQNMSQGSSDTQFMTQQSSQSPPNSQQPPPVRTVNGPTSFTNLLPKSNNSQMMVPSIVVSPQPQLRFHQQYHQNGITESTQTSLLGKRKMMENSQDGSRASRDVDENSNHSRRKMMKKSQMGPITLSPLPLNPNNNSINHNSQSSQPIPAVPTMNAPMARQHPLQQQQQPQQQPSVVQVQQQQPPDDPPKRRGRKKGSKGIDSMLNGAIPDFQADIKEKLAHSAGKRNKTTMELQQMLESQQNTAMSWQNGDLDTNSLDRGSSYQPSEPAHSTLGDDFERKKWKYKLEPQEPVTITQSSTKASIKNEKSQSQLPHQQNNFIGAVSALRSLTVEDEIAQLRAQLKPIDFDAAALDTFDDYRTVTEDGDGVECTCTFREVVTYEDDEKATISTSDIGEPPAIIKNGDVKPIIDQEDDSDDETDDFCAVDDGDIMLLRSPSPPPPPRGAVKSIFDPEYDANENLIEEMVSRRKPLDGTSKVIEVKIEKNAVKQSRIEPTLMIPEPTPNQLERTPIINYECVEDPMCQARIHFIQNPITSEDVERLHNSFMSGVNGFWNGIPEDLPEQDYSKDMENIDYSKHQLWKRVVPRYDFLTLDKIPKTFDDDSPLSVPHRSNLPTSVNDGVAVDVKPIIEADGSCQDVKHKRRDIEFREWHEVMNVRSCNDDVLTILPYVVID